MNILGFDISTRLSGYSFFTNGELSNHGVLDCHKVSDTSVRLRNMANELYDKLEELKPDCVYVEDTWMSNNPDTMSKLTMLIGVVFGWCVKNDADFHKIKPASWRSVVKLPSGKGVHREELKEMSINKVKTIYGVDCSDDESDAILIGSAGVKLES